MRRAPVLNQGYPHSENEERTNITHGQLRIFKPFSFSTRFSIFSSHALTYFVHFSWPRFTSPQEQICLMCRAMAIGWKLQNQGQEIPESASSGHKPVERRLLGAAPFGSKGAEVAFAFSC